MNARSLAQPSPDEWRLVGGVVVDDEVDVEVRRDRGINGVEELAKLHGPMSAMTAADDGARLHVQRGKERGGAMADVVPGSPFSFAGPHRQQRLGAVPGLEPPFVIGR